MNAISSSEKPRERIAKISITPDHEIGDVALKIEVIADDGQTVGVAYFSRCTSIPDALVKLNNWMNGVIIS